MDDGPQIPPALRPFVEAARALGARLTTSALEPGRSPGRLDDLARRLQRELDRTIQQAFDSLPGGGEPACCAGCDHCCRTLPVAVSPIEVFVIVHRLRDAGVVDAALEAQLAALEAGRLAVAAAGDPTLAAPERALAPCPLLGQDGLCTVYSSRPLACRGCVSADASACAACDDSRLVPRSTVHQLGASAMMRGVCDALDALGLHNRMLEIRSALALAFRDDDAEKRWLRGDDVFAELAEQNADLLAPGERPAR